MITPNTKVTALEVLAECGIKDAEKLLGKVRVRIGGIRVRSAEDVVKFQPETKKVEVIVGSELYELELAKGNKEDNAEVFTVSEGAREALDAEGKEASEQAEHLTAVKDLARKIRLAQDADQEYKPTKEEEKYLDEAIERADADREALEAAEGGEKPEAKKVKSS